MAIAGIIYYQKNDPEKKCNDKRSKIVNDISGHFNQYQKI